MNSPARDVVDYLLAQGLETGTWRIGWAREPQTPDSTVTIYDTGGGLADPDCDMDNPSIQVRVRENSYNAAYDKAIACRDALTAPNGVTINGTRYVGFWVQTDIAAIGYDENDRAILTINFNVIREDI